MEKKLTRSTTDIKIAGVCSGLAEYLGLDPTLVRIAYAAMTLCTTCFPGIILYIIMWAVMPKDFNTIIKQ